MSGFKLAGLLRLRTRHEEAARRGLGDAQTVALQAHAAARATAERAHEAAELESGTAEAFLAAQCSRAAAFASLAAAEEAERQSHLRLDEARDQWQGARSRARAVERLAEQYDEREKAAQAHLEQVESDDRSGARFGRGAGTAAPGAAQPVHETGEPR